MAIDEAIAIYLFLQHRPPGGVSPTEREAQARAWEIIYNQAEAAIIRVANQPRIFDPRDAGFSLENDGRFCRLDDPDCRHPDCECRLYVDQQLGEKS